MGRSEVRPELVKEVLSQVLDLSLAEIMKTGFLHKTRSRLTFLTRDWASMLHQDEDTAWKLQGLSGDQLLTRWANHQLSQFKVVANAVMEAMSKRSSQEGGEEEDDIEWSAREIEVYGDRCRMIRAMHRIHQLDDDQDGALLAVVYGGVFQTQESASAVPPQWADPGRVEQPPPFVAKASEVHPLSLWPLDEREAEGRALALCQAIRQVIPACPGKFLLQPGDIAQGKNSLLPAILAVIFLSNVTLPCSSGSYDLFGAVSFSVSTVLNKEKEIKGDKIRKQNTLTADVEIHVEVPPELPAHLEAMTLESRRRICSWVAAAEDFTVGSRELPSEHDPVAKSIVGCIDVMAGPWANQKAQDYSKLLLPHEALLDFLAMPAPDILLRWVNFQLTGVPAGQGATLESLDDLAGSEMLLEILSRVAADVLPLQAEEQAALRQAHNPSTTETATRRLVVAVAKRCASYHILTEESLKDEQTDLMAAFLAELLVHRPTLPAGPDTQIRQHMSSLSAIVLEAAKTEPGGLQELCAYLKERHAEIQSSLRSLQGQRQIMETVNTKMRAFALKMLVQRSKGEPCNMLELAKKVRSAEVRGDMISGDRIKALIVKEAKRLAADEGSQGAAGRNSEMAISMEKSSVQELLRRSMSSMRDTFRHYARGTLSGIETAPKEASKGRRGSRGSISGEGGQVLVVSQRSLMRLYRDCRLHTTKLTPLELEEIFNEVRLSHAMNFGQEDTSAVPLFDQGLSLEMFTEVLLTIACRAKLELFAPTACAEKLEFLIEHHLSMVGTPRDEFVYALIVDTSLDEVLNEFAGRLRSIFTAYAGSARNVERDRRRHRGAMVEVTAVSTQKQSMCMSLDAFTDMLGHAGLLSKSINRARVGMIFRGLQELQRCAGEA
ncbi:unnamed protein product [Symbiodinium sp. CCMP2592]|nr:unnamed protein product [Symbiodinium sp. CCMP2592]